ncbi:peptide-binding protein [Streptomyces badius]
MLAACGSTDSGAGGKGAIVVGTTDQLVASKENPAPLDPAIGYEAGVWNVLRQTVQTLTTVPGGGEPVPEAARSCTFTDTANESSAAPCGRASPSPTGRPSPPRT